MASQAKVPPTPATSEEQRAMLGNVRRIPRDVDMFTGEVVTKPPKRGNGSHIQLKSTGLEKPVVPGMASYAGEGPPGTYCKDCKHFGEVAVLRPDGNETVEMNRKGCVIWAQRMGHAQPMSAKTIEINASCKHFKNSGGVNRYIISQTGETIAVPNFPLGNLHTWDFERRAALAEGDAAKDSGPSTERGDSEP